MIARDERLVQYPQVFRGLTGLSITEFDSTGPVDTPRRKPRKRPRPEADVRYNRAVARRRVRVEHTIGRMRWYRAISDRDRHHRRFHPVRERAIAGLVNRQIDHRLAAYLVA